jgi:hypothetical protein
MRILTHNLLQCHVKGCTSSNFPLKLEEVEVEQRESEFNPDFLINFLSRLEWSALATAASQVRQVVPCHRSLPTTSKPVLRLVNGGSLQSFGEAGCGLMSLMLPRPCCYCSKVGLMDFPDSMPSETQDEDFLRLLHKLLIEVLAGTLAFDLPSSFSCFLTLFCI